MGPVTFKYDELVEEALRGMVRRVLRRVAERGLPGAHHFIIGFRTDAPGVEISDALKARYREELTIILQHEFWGLEVEEQRFSVTLSFSNVGERLTVPFSALTVFSDPSARFGLQLQNATQAEPEAATPAAAMPAPPSAPKPIAATDRDGAAEEDGAKVVTLDAFRKK